MKRILTFALLLFASVGGAYSQSACYGLKNPTNFALYYNYKGQLGAKVNVAPNPITGETGMSFTGTVLGNTQLPVGTTANCTDGRYRIMSSTDPNDPNTGGALPVVPPGFSNSIRIGNCNTGGEAEALYYDMMVTQANAMLQFYFAIVVETPYHGITGDPTFVIRILLDTTPTANTPSYAINQLHHDTSCYMITSSGVSNNVNGWHSYGQVFYRDWHMACINLCDYLYQRVRIEVMMSDCGAHGHYGYAYFVGDCKPMSIWVHGCYSGSSDTVGFAGMSSDMGDYQWYRSKNGLTSSKDLSNYTIIPGATDSVLAVRVEDFISENDGDTLAQNTFLCQITTYMDPAKPLHSEHMASVNNMKPILRLDSLLDCNRGITLWDHSSVVYDAGDEINQVDTSRTEWAFYETEQPVGDPVYTATGGTASYEFATAGNHSVVVRSYTYRDGMCWNEKTATIRTIESPEETLLYDTVCRGSDYAEYGFSVMNAQENDTLTQELAAVNGCDSTVTLYLTVMPTYHIVIEDTVARGESYTQHGFNLNDLQESGTYTLELTTLQGCDSIVTLNLTVQEVGIETIEKGDAFAAVLYPNPADESVTLHVEALPNDAEVSLCDAQGRRVLVQTLQAGQETLSLNISTLAAGSYHLRIASNGSTVLRKLIVQ